MTSHQDFQIGVEARAAVVHRAGGVSAHDIAVQEYLTAMQIQQDVPHRKSYTPAASAPPADTPTTTPTAESGTREEAPARSAPEDRRSHEGAVVVGIDYSPAARVAAKWAAAEADRRHAELRLVHAFVLPAMAGYPDYNAIPDDLQSTLRAEGQDMLEQVATDLRGRYPDLRITTALIHERAVVALREASEHAQLTVVGATGASRVSGVFTGSVTLGLTSTNPAPIAVVHQLDALDATGPVVVGVDGSPTSEAAVAFAFDEAALRNTELVAVHAWSDVVVEGSRRLQPILVDPQTLEQEEEALLAQRLAGWAEKYPDVTVRRVVVARRPTPALLDEAKSAQLLVVGSHGRGGFTGMLLGSTSHAVVGHSACPVVVVRPAHS